MVNIRISDTYSGCSRDFSSGSPDYPVFAFILILLCQRVRTLSPLVSWNEFIPNASGQLCEGTGHDAKDQTLHPAAGVRHAHYRHVSDVQFTIPYFDHLFDSF